jgi:hypothetical protein
VAHAVKGCGGEEEEDAGAAAALPNAVAPVGSAKRVLLRRRAKRLQGVFSLGDHH